MVWLNVEQIILNILKEATPIGAIVLSLVIIFQLIRQKKDVKTIRDNHSHEIVDALKRIEDKLEKMNDNVLYIKTKINGKN